MALTALYAHLDELHTMTSLSGFEALVQGVRVIAWGQPFYAGWGLTRDINPFPRRERRLTLAQLVLGTLALYPAYFDWETRLWITAEQQIRKLAAQEGGRAEAYSRLKRWAIKVDYLRQTLTGATLPLLR